VFITLSYASEERTGSHVIVGVAELDGLNPGLLQKPKRENRDWLLDEVLNPSDYAGLFEVFEQLPDGLQGTYPSSARSSTTRACKRS